MKSLLVLLACVVVCYAGSMGRHGGFYGTHRGRHGDHHHRHYQHGGGIREHHPYLEQVTQIIGLGGELRGATYSFYRQTHTGAPGEDLLEQCELLLDTYSRIHSQMEDIKQDLAVQGESYGSLEETFVGQEDVQGVKQAMHDNMQQLVFSQSDEVTFDRTAAIRSLLRSIKHVCMRHMRAAFAHLAQADSAEEVAIVVTHIQEFVEGLEDVFIEVRDMLEDASDDDAEIQGEPEVSVAGDGEPFRRRRDVTDEGLITVDTSNDGRRARKEQESRDRLMRRGGRRGGRRLSNPGGYAVGKEQTEAGGERETRGQALGRGQRQDGNALESRLAQGRGRGGRADDIQEATRVRRETDPARDDEESVRGGRQQSESSRGARHSRRGRGRTHLSRPVTAERPTRRERPDFESLSEQEILEIRRQRYERMVEQRGSRGSRWGSDRGEKPDRYERPARGQGRGERPARGHVKGERPTRGQGMGERPERGQSRDETPVSSSDRSGRPDDEQMVELEL